MTCPHISEPHAMLALVTCARHMMGLLLFCCLFSDSVSGYTLTHIGPRIDTRLWTHMDVMMTHPHTPTSHNTACAPSAHVRHYWFICSLVSSFGFASCICICKAVD